MFSENLVLGDAGRNRTGPSGCQEAWPARFRGAGAGPGVSAQSRAEPCPAPRASARDRLTGACSVLADATTRGLCGSWGIASWDSRPLAALGDLPQPDVLIVQAGLLVGVEILEAADLLAERWRPSAVVWDALFGLRKARPTAVLADRD